MTITRMPRADALAACMELLENYGYSADEYRLRDFANHVLTRDGDGWAFNIGSGRPYLKHLADEFRRPRKRTDTNTAI